MLVNVLNTFNSYACSLCLTALEFKNCRVHLSFLMNYDDALNFVALRKVAFGSAE